MDVKKNNDLGLLYFDQHRTIAEANYVTNPQDADNLTRWAGALLTLSRFQSSIEDSVKMIKDAIMKLEEALKVNPEQHHTLWCLGNAHSYLAIVTGECAVPINFQKASHYFEQAVGKDPNNEIYLKSKKMSDEELKLQKLKLQKLKLQKLKLQASKLPMETSQQLMGGGSSGSSNPKAAKKPKSSDLTYYIFGGVILGVGIFGWIWMSKSQFPPSPPR